MSGPLFVELTTGQTAVHVSIRARVEAAALCSELQSALQAIHDTLDQPVQRSGMDNAEQAVAILRVDCRIARQRALAAIARAKAAAA